MRHGPKDEENEGNKITLNCVTQLVWQNLFANNYLAVHHVFDCRHGGTKQCTPDTPSHGQRE